MKIIRQIDTAVEAFRWLVNHVRPINPSDIQIYLGWVQAAEFVDAAQQMSTVLLEGPEHKRHTDNVSKHGHRYEYRGMRVFTVDAENHLAVGF